MSDFPRGNDSRLGSPVTDSTKEKVAISPSKPPAVDNGLIPVDRDGMKEVVPPDHSAPQVVEYSPYYASTPQEQYPQEQPRGYHVPEGNTERGVAPASGRKRKWKWFIIGAIILLAVIVAAVVGGVVGSQSHKNNSKSSSSPSASPSPSPSGTASFLRGVGNSGLAAAPHADGQGMLMYYQTLNNSIIEAYFTNGVLTTNNTRQDPSQSQAVLPITDIIQGSPLAALIYTVNNTQFKQLFFVNSQYRIMQINAPGMNAAWGSPTQISPPSSSQVLVSGSFGLDACVSTTGSLKGIRLYFSSAVGYIQEISWNFGDFDVTNMWYQQFPFKGSDPTGGVTCTANQNGDGTTTVNLWMRNSTVGHLAHWYYVYTNHNQGGIWTQVAETNLNNQAAYDLPAKSPITAILDSSNTNQYLFWGGSDGLLKMASGQVGKNGSASTSVSPDVGPVGFPQIASYYIGGAPLILRQIASSGALEVVSVGPDGTTFNNNTLYD